MAPASPITTTTTLLRQSVVVSPSDRFRGGLSREPTWVPEARESFHAAYHSRLGYTKMWSAKTRLKSPGSQSIRKLLRCFGICLALSFTFLTINDSPAADSL